MAMTARGSGLVPGPRSDRPPATVEMIVTYRAICVDAVMYLEGDRVMMSEHDARDAESIGRAKRYVASPLPIVESPLTYEPEPEGEFVPPIESPAPTVKRKRIGKLTKDGG